jgi:hypothetical protein
MSHIHITPLSLTAMAFGMTLPHKVNFIYYSVTLLAIKQLSENWHDCHTITFGGHYPSVVIQIL